MTYYRDFAKYYGLKLIESVVYEGSQLDGSMLITSVMGELVHQYELNDVGYCIFADWMEDFDSEYSALSPYLLDNAWTQLGAIEYC